MRKFPILFYIFNFIFGCTHSMWNFPRPEIELVPQYRPIPQKWQYCIFNSLSHKGTPENSLFLSRLESLDYNNMERVGQQEGMTVFRINCEVMAIINKLNNKMLESVWRKGNPPSLWWECKSVRLLKKLNIGLTYDPAIPLLGIYLNKTFIQKDMKWTISLQHYSQ